MKHEFFQRSFVIDFSLFFLFTVPQVHIGWASYRMMINCLPITIRIFHDFSLTRFTS